MSNLLKDASILLTPTAYDNGRMLSIKPSKDLYGPELITNGDFSNGSNDWVIESTWTVANELASGNGANGGGQEIKQTNVLTVGKNYKITYEVKNWVSGSVRENHGAYYSQDGVYTEYITATRHQVIFRGDDFIGDITNVGVKEDLSGDMYFSRNSAATRVNAQGLVENVQILSSNLVQNGSFSEEGAEEVTNGSFSEQGAELVTNGDFATTIPINTNGSGWKRIVQDGNTVEYANGGVKLTVLGVSTNECKLYAQTVGGSSNILTVGKTYKLTYTVLENNGVSNFTYYIGGSYKTIPNTVGTHNYYFTQASNQLSVFRNNNLNSDITLDNVSVKEVGQDWILDANWSIGDDKAISDGTSGNLYQSGIIVTGKQYKIQATVSDYVSGNVEVSAGAVPRGTMSANGTYTFYQTASSTINFFIISNSFTGSIANISVKEVLQNWSVKDYGAVSASAVITPNTEGVKLEKTVSADWRSSFLVQPFSYTSGSQYKVTFKLKNGNLPSGGGVYVRALYDSSSHGIVNNLTLTNDWVEYTYYYTADSNSLDISFGNVDWQNAGVGQYFYVDDVSVIEITDDTNLPRINYEGFSYQDALGSEQVVNGDFATNLNGWIVDTSRGTYTWDNSRAKITNNIANSYPNISQTITTIAGKVYKINSTIEIGTASNTEIRAYDNGVLGSQQLNADGNIDFTFTAVGTSTRIHCYLWETGNTGNYCFFDNVSVKEYFGQEVVPDSGCGAWLFEPESTNRIPYSEDFSQWTDGSSITISNSSSVSSPSNSNSVGIITGTVATNSKFVRIDVTTTSLIHTYSAFFKYNTQQFIQFASGGTSEYANFDIQNGVVGNKLAGTTSTIEKFPNGWYRCTLSTSVASSPSNMAVVFIDSATSARLSPTSSVDSVYIWGAQLEQQDYATSYIPTSGASSTRLQDIATGSGNATLINSTEGVLYAEIAALADDNIYKLLEINNGGTTDRVYIAYRNSLLYGSVIVGGVTQFVFSFTLTVTDFNKVALKYKENYFALWINGLEVATDTSGITSSSGVLNNIDFSNSSNGIPFYGKTKALAVYKGALTDANLRGLTYPPAVATTFDLNFNTIATDFTFTRGSEATFVNAQGLIQSTNEIGSELITNGDFATNINGWSGNTTKTWNNGTLVSAGVGALNNTNFQSLNLTAGKTYRFTWEIVSTDANASFVYLSTDGQITNSYVGAGTFTEDVTIVSNSLYVDFRFTGANTTTVFKSLSVKEVISATNTPRLDYSTGAEAFLLEPQSTNLFLQSEIFTSWNGYQATSNTTTSPSGNSVLFLDFEDARMFPTTRNFPNSTECTSSIYLKANKVADVRFRSVSGQDVLISLTTDWVRYELTATSISTTTNTLLIDARFSQGLGASGLEIALWGGQIEQNSYATSYIPTSGASATRNQELCVDATPVINSEEGVLYAEIAALADDETFRLLGFSDGTNANRVYIGYSSTDKITCSFQVSSSVVYSFNFTTDITINSKLAIKYKENDFAIWVNGVEVNSQSSGNTFPIGTLTQMQFASATTFSPFFGNTKGLKYYPKALADVQLEDLTTI